MSTSEQPELNTRRVAAYVAGEVWPRFVQRYPGTRKLEIYAVVEKLAATFLFPENKSQEQIEWYRGVSGKMPEAVNWLENEFSEESDELLRLEISDNARKNQIGQLKFLILLGVEEWSQIRNYSKSGSIEKAAEVILRMPDGSFRRKFESAIRQVAKIEEKHKVEFKELLDASVPRSRSIEENYPDLAKEFPDAVAKLDQKLQESREAQIKGLIADGFSEMAKRLSSFIDAISQALETTSDEVKRE